MGKVLKKEGLNDFILSLQKKGELIAPVTTDMTRFKVLEPGDRIELNSNAFFPLKKYFLPNEEPILKIRNGKTKELKQKEFPKIIFGTRLCDINGLAILDKLFLDHEFVDEVYKKKRENTIVIGFNCLTRPSEYCFCGSMDLKKEAYDLMLHERDNDYYIDVLTKKGAKLVKYLKNDNFNYPLPKTDKKMKEKDLWPFMADKFWEKDNELCVSCQRCTILCPTCFCFDFYDDVNPATKNGSRIRNIDSCHSKDFTEVAGGHVFREKRLQRYRHRVMHKLQFFKDKFNRSMCTGCGRCIEYCHSKIDFVTTVNKFTER